jgi:hypothetical protein
MYLVKTYIERSSIDGVGVFSDENITSGQRVWELNRYVDIVLPESEFDSLPEIAKIEYSHSAYHSERLQSWVLCCDNSKYTNHSLEKQNIQFEYMEDSDDLVGIAMRDIQISEELFVDYREFDQSMKDSDQEYLNK